LRETDDGFLLVRQHDHGLASGEFARCLSHQPRPYESVLYAVTNHDVAWREPDGEVLWDEERDRPYSFLTYPRERRLPAQRRGIDLVERGDPYAGCLCSMHYARFLEGSEEPLEVAFREGEEERQRRLRAGMSGEELENLERNFRFLRLCDGLSLFVCLNEPGRGEYPPPTPGGFELDGERFVPVWEDERTLRFEPSPFAEPFELAIPCFFVGRDRRLLGSGRIGVRVVLQLLSSR
jgi:hypothetical protein